jgi:hypothetical protein
METEKIIPPFGFSLGIAGLIPFIFLAVADFLMPDSYKPMILFSLLAYGASISSFLGAIHWGLTMRDETPNTMYLLWGVCPSLIAWCSLMLKPALGLLLTSALLWLCFFIDTKIYPKYSLKHWLPMRLGLTIIASFSCLVTAF